jgi:hypothetical protein
VQNSVFAKVRHKSMYIEADFSYALNRQRAQVKSRSLSLLNTVCYTVYKC